MNSASLAPYSLSPTIGCPMDAKWTRIWCWRPVSGCASHKACAGSRRITRNFVTAASPEPSAGAGPIITRDFVSSRHSGTSILPSSGGWPFTSARYVFSTARRANARVRTLATCAVARDQQHPRRFAIDAMGNLHLLVGIALAQHRDQCVPPELRGRVHRQAGGLVDDHDALVFEQDVEVPRHLRFDRGRPPQQDRLPGAHRRRRPGGAAVRKRDLLADDRLDARARHPADSPLEEMIQPPPAAFGRDDDVALDDVDDVGQNLFSCVAARGLLAAFASSSRRAPSISR